MSKFQTIANFPTRAHTRMMITERHMQTKLLTFWKLKSEILLYQFPHLCSIKIILFGKQKQQRLTAFSRKAKITLHFSSLTLRTRKVQLYIASQSWLTIGQTTHPTSVKSLSTASKTSVLFIDIAECIDSFTSSNALSVKFTTLSLQPRLKNSTTTSTTKNWTSSHQVGSKKVDAKPFLYFL